MKIYRGNVCIDLTLSEFYDLLGNEDGIENILDTIFALEMDEAMSYSEAEIKEFEKKLLKEIQDYQTKQKNENNIEKMKRIIQHLSKYEQ